MPDDRPVGIFDSGVGGLTVARAVIELLPHERFIYVGDAARFPYGPRPIDEIRRFALEIAGSLVDRDVKMLVVACNSVEVSAIDDIAARHGIPVAGVIDPGARAAVRATRNGRIGVIGTQATVASGAYDRAIARTGAAVELISSPCPAFVEHVERGDTTSDELRELARGYLSPLRDRGVDTVIMGCTHYPLLSGLLQMELGPGVVLVSSAEETAKDVYGVLVREHLEREGAGTPMHEFLSTGDPARFQALAELFIGPAVGEVRAAHLAPVGGGSWN